MGHYFSGGVEWHCLLVELSSDILDFIVINFIVPIIYAIAYLVNFANNSHRMDRRAYYSWLTVRGISVDGRKSQITFQPVKSHISIPPKP